MEKKKISKIMILAMITVGSLLGVGCSDTNAKKEDNKNETVMVGKGKENTTETVEKKEDLQKEETPKEKEAEKITEEKNKGQAVKIHFIDTGNSDAILIDGEKNLLIDGGDNGDEEIIGRYLNNLNIDKLDYMVATHPHADHIGGLDGVINKVKVDKLLVANGDSDTKTYRDFINSAANKGLKPSVPLEGAEFKIGKDSYFKVFNSNGGKDENDQSLIILFVNGNDKVLLTGDAEEDTEREAMGKMVDIDLLKVGHHGSRSSTSREFLNKVNPEFAVITVGSDNKYGHPHKETMGKLESGNIKVHRTDECGNIVFTSTGNGLETSCKDGSYNSGQSQSQSKKENPKPKTEEKFNNSNESGKVVWLSQTGKKYHTINNCGRMNPDTARKIDISKAKDYEACSKCA